MSGRPHDPESCVMCVEVPHFAGYGESPWQVAARLGVTVESIERHIYRHRHILGAHLEWVRQAASVERVRRRKQQRDQEAAA